MFRKLLVPLDRSPLAEQALGQAAALARASQAEIEIVLVHQPFPFGSFTDASRDAQVLDQDRQYLESIAAELISGSNVPVTPTVLRGEAIETITQRVADAGADLVVMTSHGRTGIAHAWFGSVAAGVLRQSTVPVLILRPVEGKTRRDAARHLFKRILIPVDGSALSVEVFGAATSLAQCSGAQITLLRVVQPIMLLTVDPSIASVYVPAIVDEPLTKRLTEEATEQLAGVARRLQEESHGDVETQVVVDPRIAAAIIDFAHGHHIDVIAMSTHGRGMSRLFLGSVADKVLRGSELPMLLYRPTEM
ncbi:MAG TPA: universal stress protein [Gemmatimonadaceae bacterium]